MSLFCAMIPDHMDSLVLENRDGTLVIRMARGKANALNAAMVAELNAAVARARDEDGIRAVVLASARPGFFSTGFDVADVFGYGRDDMAEFFGRFIDLYEGLARLRKPVVAAITGHAFAGGAVLALAADARVWAEGDFGFALNEVNLGVVLPPGIIRLARRAVGAARASELLLSGRTVPPSGALEIGLALEVTSPESTLERARERAAELGGKPRAAFGAIKGLIGEIEDSGSPGSDRDNLGVFLDHWFSKEAEERKAALVRSLRR